MFNKLDIQVGYNILEAKLQGIINIVAPLRKIVISEKHPISNHSLRSLENRRKTLYKKMKKSKTDKLIGDYKCIKKKIKSQVKMLRKTEVKKMLKNRDMKNVWQGVNTICGRNTSQTDKVSLLSPVDGKIVSEERACADIFASAFKSKVDKLVDKVGATDAMVNKTSTIFHDQEDSSPQFTLQEIIGVIVNMKRSSSSGHDDISINYIKDAVSHLAPVLKFIFDKVALFAKMPTQWKLAKIVPLHKKGSKVDPENYRPISLLCSLGKVFERCLLNVMTTRFGDHLPSSFQHGFRKNHSTSTAALSVQSIIARALDRKKKVVVVSTDMSAAFDLLDKDVLLPRMSKLGIPPSLCNIYREFLSERRAHVQCGQSRSADFCIPVGCVQGSPSGPYLFTLLVDGISEHLPEVNIVAYADDMYFIYEADSWEKVVEKASEETNKAIKWLKKSGMVINASKTEACHFSYQVPDPIRIEVDSAVIEVKSCLKVLGLIFDHRMSWGPHIENLLKEANSRIQAIRHIRPHLTKDECLNVAHGLFFGKFYYGSSVWLTGMLSSCLLNRLTVASNSCLRAVLGYRIRDISTVVLHREAGILTPYQHCFLDGAMMFWRIINSCEPYNLYMDLLNQGAHHERNFHYYMNYFKQSGNFAFPNRLNDILSLLGDSWLDQSNCTVKKIVKKQVLEKVPAKRD